MPTQRRIQGCSDQHAAIHYRCSETGSEFIVTGIWLDDETGWMLGETFTDGGGVTTVTATEIEFGPDIDDDTFSTDLPAGEDDPSDP
jgi:outer membrane lipoprotein-sorting protein